jgi:hypothetical protein
MYSLLPTNVLLRLFSLAMHKDFSTSQNVCALVLLIVCSSVNKMLTERRMTLQDHIFVVQQGNEASVAGVEDYKVSEHKKQ